MNFATWNINGINRRIALLLRWLEEASPDVLCLQELKCTPNQFPEAALAAAGYGAIWHAEGRWNGVAILARDRVPVAIRDELPGEESDKQVRYIEAAIDGYIIASVYAPNGNPYPGPKYDYKLDWMRRLKLHVQALPVKDAPIVLAGDFNVVPEKKDIYETTSYDTNALVQSSALSALSGILEEGYSDAQRLLDAEVTNYTFWDYRRDRWKRDAGLRLDLFLLSQRAADMLSQIEVDRHTRDWPDPSDHAPVRIELG